MKRRSFLFYTLAAVTTTGLNIKPAFASSGQPDSFTIDLNSELVEVGSSKTIKNMIVIRIKESNESDSFTAFSNKCTHRGCKISFNSENNQFICPCHKSIFNIKGETIQGPAKKPLAQYTASVKDKVLTVTSQG